MTPDEVEKKDLKTKVEIKSVVKNYIHPDYEIEINPNRDDEDYIIFDSGTGHPLLFTLKPNVESLPKFTSRIDENLKQGKGYGSEFLMLDTDILDTEGYKVEKIERDDFKKEIKGNCGHHTKKSRKCGWIFNLKIIFKNLLIFEGEIYLTFHRSVKLKENIQSSDRCESDILTALKYGASC